MDRPRLIAEARALRMKWDTGEYVSVALAVALANRLADAVESHREEDTPRSSADAA